MAFDPNTFMNTTFGDVSDKVIPIPADEYMAVVDKVDSSNGIIGKGDRAGQPWVRLDVSFEPVDEKSKEACQAVGLSGVPKIRYGIMLNLDDDGRLKTGDNDNPRVGRLLKALGIEGDWTPQTLIGQSCIIQVKHDVNPETGDAYANVAGVAAA